MKIVMKLLPETLAKRGAAEVCMMILGFANFSRSFGSLYMLLVIRIFTTVEAFTFLSATTVMYCVGGWGGGGGMITFLEVAQLFVGQRHIVGVSVTQYWQINRCWFHL